MHFITPVRQRIHFRLYPRRHTDRNAYSMPETFGAKCMECTLLALSSLPFGTKYLLFLAQLALITLSFWHKVQWDINLLQ